MTLINIEKKKLYIGVLSYNRAKEFVESVKSLMISLNYTKLFKKVNIRVFDDFSNIDEFKIIKNFCQINKIKIIRNSKNVGFGINCINAVNWYTSNKDCSSMFYLHETDLILEKKWFEKVSKVLNYNNNLIISPVHHRNHLNYIEHAKGMNKVFIDEIGENVVKKKKLTLEHMIKNEGKTIFKCKDFKCKITYGIIGSRVANYPYWKEIIKQKKFILKQVDKEDMALSYLGKDRCVYFIPGSANIAFKKGLHGYMFLNVASYDHSFYKFSSILKIRRNLIIASLKILDLIKIKIILKKLVNF
jgi:hypothetical protein